MRLRWASGVMDLQRICHFEMDLSSDFQYPLILCQRVLTLWTIWQWGLDNLKKHSQEGCSINKERGNLSAK
jgi:hypothetical protein